MSWNLIEHADAGLLARAVAERLAMALDAALHNRGQAVLALAGGRTAPPIFSALAGAGRCWEAVTLLPTDERWVDATHVDNNLRQMRAGFASVQQRIRWCALVPEHAQGTPDAGLAERNLAGLPEFDACMLGMGADGHFASLFAGAAGLEHALALDNPAAATVIVPDPLPVAGAHARISLTLARLLRSRLLLLVISGADKRAVLQGAQREADPGKLPVAALLHNPLRSVEVHWSP